MSTRVDVLGYDPQKESIYNKLLPYSEKIDKETVNFLAEIKGNLGRSVQIRDLKYGTSHWIGQLSRYIRLYGHNFSKDDHIYLIKLLFELLTIPDLEMSLVQKYAAVLTVLLKKRELISREDLELPWRPLYRLVESVMYSQYEHHGLQLFPSNIENVLKNIVRCCRVYFSLESTQEMLDEWRPLLCPFDVTVIKALNYFELFLPTSLPPEHHHKGFKLWFDEMIQLWLSFHNNPSWEYSLVSLFTRLANHNIGYIDWTPYVDQIFTRFLRSFNLPVGHQVVQKSSCCYDIMLTVTWIVAMLGGGSVVQDHVTKLFTALESFYHPSNMGRWNLKLSTLLMSFPKVYITRLHRERYRKPSWENQVPEAFKLTDSDVTAFVESIKSVCFVAMFGKHGSMDAAIALRHLATMRPEIVIPPLLEKMYPAMETLIEPHRLIACMNCVVSVARPMLQAGKWFPLGRTHLLPLLNLSLPGIDPNDFKKCLVTFQMISTFVSLVPIVDCSEAIHVRSDLTEEEREVCSATAQFEDWVLQFLDRVFTLIENSAQESTCGAQDRLNPEQSMLEVGMASTSTSVLQQCSSAIFDSAVRRLHRFLTGNVYETKVSGRFAANLCRSAAKVNPAKTLKMFLPHFCQSIINYVKEHGDIQKEEQLDDSFLWNLQMLTQLVRCNGRNVLEYREPLMEVLSLTLSLQCVQGYEMSGMLLRYLLRALVLTYPQEYCSVVGSLDRPFEEYLPIRDWAIPGDLHNLQVDWHVPSEAEQSFAAEILDRFLAPELALINDIQKDGKLAPSREDLLRRLNLVLETILGSAALLPMWEGEAVPVMETDIPLTRFQSTAHVVGELKLKGDNVRSSVADTMINLLAYMHSSCEDDTKGFVKVMRILETVLFFCGTAKNDFDGRWKSFHVVKGALADNLRGKKRHIRALLVDRLQLQHELLLLNSKSKVFTSRHQEIWNHLLQLSLSRYSEVRKKAQACLLSAFTNFPYTYRSIIKEIAQNLENNNVPEYKFKGSLYTILGNGKKCLATKRNWEILSLIWPALAQAQHSEKPSILKVIDDIVTRVVKCLETVAIRFETPLACIESAGRLLKSTAPSPSCGPTSDGDLKRGVEREKEWNEKNLQEYVKLMNKLSSLVESGKLMWKFSQISMEFMALLLRHDEPAPPQAVACFVKHLCHDALYIRKLAMSAVSAVLKQQKRKHPKVVVDPYKRSGTLPPQSAPPPGEREDNMWHQYDSSSIPDTQEKWVAAAFVDKTHWGYYCWPKEMLVYAPYEKQPKPERSRSEMSDSELCILDNFSNQEFVDKLISFLSLEEQKGRDKFRTKYLVFFKGLFRNYGDTFLPLFQPHIERLMGDQSHDKHDSSQRSAMEILAGIVRGSKHWHFDKVEKLWKWVCPLLTTSLNNITIETVDDWGSFYTSLSESRDPRKLHWLLELLMKHPLSGEGGAFGDASRLFAVQNALIDQEWRVPQLMHRLLEYLKPHLAHPYKNVRDRIGSVLCNIFLYDYRISPKSGVRSPLRKPFLEEMLPQLTPLLDLVQEQNGAATNGPKGTTDEAAPSSSNTNKSEPMETEDSGTEDNGTEDTERKKTIRLCKTVMKWLQNNHNRAFNPCSPEVLSLLPIICCLESESVDVDLKSDCSTTLACLASSLYKPDHIPLAFKAVREVMGLQSWHARAAVLRFVQGMVFGNLFLMDTNEHRGNIHDILLHLICDEQLEVREMAGETLSGLLHCAYLNMNESLIAHFERLSRTKLAKRKKTSETVGLESLIQRHAGVLGLGACVQAFPYQVPAFIPRVLMVLSAHVNDPQPIQMSVKKILSNFRRTHYDNWHDHKLKFTDDQLVVLTDLLVSPNYYA